jgi:hypothetical protein
MNVVQCLSHSIEAYDQLRLYAHLGIDAFDVGGYIDPAHPHDDKRPGVPEMAFHPDLKAAVDSIGVEDNLKAAQENLPDALLDWADVVIYHHYLDRLYGQWPRIRRWLHGGSHRRVIWRTVGQSVDGNEATAQPFVKDGLEVVRYSPKERNIPNYAGESALIRFYKDPDEWYGWTGEKPVVLNISQHDALPHARDEWLNWAFWEQATGGLRRTFAGPHSEKVGGLGALSIREMQHLLRMSRAYLYTGTQPASYTLGLIEALMTGIPVVSIGPSHMRIFQPYGPALFEGHEIARESYDDPARARVALATLLDEPDRTFSELQRAKAIEMFGKATIAAQWARFLDVKVPATVAA